MQIGKDQSSGHKALLDPLCARDQFCHSQIGHSAALASEMQTIQLYLQHLPKSNQYMETNQALTHSQSLSYQ